MDKHKRSLKTFWYITILTFFTYLFMRIAEFLGANYFGDRNGEIGSSMIKLGLVVVFSLIVLFLIIFSIWWMSNYLHHFEIPQTYFWSIVITLGITFLIASNTAWLNPRPNFRDLGGDFLKLSSKIPLFWQYNLDSTLELETAENFPAYYRTCPIRISRPVYPMIVNIISHLVAPGFKPTMLSTVFGYLILKITNFLIGALLMFQFLREYLPDIWALAATLLTFTHSFSIIILGTYHTYELQFISPIIILFMFVDLDHNYTLKKNIFYSLIVGLLMLAKQNYAPYFAVIIFAFLYRRYKEAIISLAVHLIPLLFWVIFLKIYDLKYYDHGAEAYGQGIWLYQEFIHLSFPQMFASISEWIINYMIAFSHYYQLIGLLAIMGLIYLTFSRKLKMNWCGLFGLFLFMDWLQMFAARQSNDYMTSGMSIFIFPLAVCSFIGIEKKWRLILVPLLIAWFVFQVIRMVHFPWIHPYNQ